MLFLGRIQSGAFGGEGVSESDVDWLVSSWIMAGVLVVSTVTVPLGVLGTMINDRVTKKISDFYTAPIDRKILALSYLISAWIVGFMMVTLNLLIGQIYIVSQGGEFLSLFGYVKVIGLMTLSIMAFSTFFYYISLFMKTSNAFSLLSTLVGTFIGFLGGIYVQIGLMPYAVRGVMNMLPTAHSVVLMRRLFMDEVIDKVFQGYSGPEFVEFADDMGLNANVFGTQLSTLVMVLSLVLFGVVFYILSVLKLNKSKL